MSDTYLIKGETLTAIADEIRRCASGVIPDDEKITPVDMRNHISDIYGYGYSDGGSEGYEVGWDEGWETGFYDGYAEGEDFGYTAGKTDGIADGKQQATNDFWDTYIRRCEQAGYAYSFSGHGLADEIYNPTKPIMATGEAALNYMFTYAYGITSTKVPIVFDNTSPYNTHIFYYCGNLKTIPSIKVTENMQTFQYWFRGCEALEEVNFTEDSVIKASISFVHSPKLNIASVQTIIHALKDLTGATAQTLTLHATVGGKLTEEQKAAISAKNWTLVY